MRKIDFQKDQEFYSGVCKAPGEYTDDPLDMYRFNLLLKLFRKFDKKNGLFENRSVLNVAAGFGREAYLIMNQGPKQAVLCDYSLQQVKEAQRYLPGSVRKDFLCADGEHLPFKDKSFDVSFITEALHHFLHPDTGLNELSRVSRRYILLDEPADGPVRRILNRLFIFLGVKEELERGYLEASRINKELLGRISQDCGLDILFFPYFIYYFAWYKRTKNTFVKKIYKNLLLVFNVFFHYFGNRAIVILRFKQGSNN